MEKRITTPLTEEKVKDFKAGDTVLISGIIYAARDAAHKRLIDLINEGKELPFDVRDAIIYYVGPTPTKPGMAFGSAGPTTSYRMDPYTIPLLERGLRGMIGKGFRGKDIIASMVENKAVYFAATGGAGALIGKSIKSSKIVAYEDLGAEAILELQVENFPAVVVIDSEGNNLYEIGQKNYLESITE